MPALSRCSLPQAKERARDTLARRYRCRGLDEEAILHCLYSISDNNSYLLFNRDPVDRCGALAPCVVEPLLASLRVACSLVLAGGEPAAAPAPPL